MHRYQSHHHVSKHHSGWRDIVGIGFVEATPADLDCVEREMMAQHWGRFHLQRKMWNLANTEASLLGATVSVVEQQHWANGYP